MIRLRSFEFQDGVPIARGASGAEFFFDESIGEARAADPGRVDDISLSALDRDELRTFNGGLECLDFLQVRRAFQERDDKVGRIALGLVRKWIVRDDPLPRFSRSDKKVGVKIQALGGLLLQQAFEVNIRSLFAFKDQVAALEQRSRLFEAKFCQQAAQFSHGDRLAAADIDSAKKGNVH